MRLHRRAAFIALTYLVIGIIYILVSDHVVALLSHSVVDVETFGRIKGVLFIVATAAGLFWFSSDQIKRVVGDAVNLIQNRTMLFSYERKSLAGLFSITMAEELGRILARNDGGAAAPEIQELIKKLERAGLAAVSEGKRKVELSAMLRSSVDIAKGYSPLVRSCEVRIGESRNVMVSIYAGLVHQMLVNLLINAAESVKGKGKIQVDLRKDENQVVIEVHDSGPGIPADKWTSLLDPFYSTKREGMGFGLLAVKACAAAHGGRVEISASHLGGARVDVQLPILI